MDRKRRRAIKRKKGVAVEHVQPEKRYERPAGAKAVVGDVIEYQRALNPRQDSPHFRAGLRATVTRVYDGLLWHADPGRAGNLYITVETDLGHVHEWGWRDDQFKCVQAYHPDTYVKPTRFRDLLLPVPQEAATLTVQLKPTPRIVAHFEPAKRKNVVQALNSPAVELQFETPKLAMAMDLAFSSTGRLNPGALNGYGFTLWAVGEKALHWAPWVWGNVHPQATICWGYNATPTNLRRAWAEFWDFPTNEHLTPLFRQHARDCRWGKHDCATRRCQRKHVCTLGELGHHQCEKRRTGFQACGEHRFPRYHNPDLNDWQYVDHISMRLHHIQDAAELAKLHASGHITDWKGCYCKCCFAQGDPWHNCGCGPQVRAESRKCACCFGTCNCLKNCTCCSRYCACRSGCDCCDGRCACARKSCTCKLSERFADYLATYRPAEASYRDVTRWLQGDAHVQLTRCDAVFLSDNPKILERVPEKFRVDGALVGAARRAVVDGATGWHLEFVAGEERFTLPLKREEIKLCV